MDAKPLNTQLFIYRTDLWPESARLSSWALNMITLLVPLSGESLLATVFYPVATAPGTCGVLEGANSSPAAFIFSLSASSLWILLSCNMNPQFVKFFIISSFWAFCNWYQTGGITSVFSLPSLLAYWPCMCSFLQTKVRIENCCLSLISFSKAWPWSPMWASIICCSTRAGSHRDVLSPPALEAQAMLHVAQPSVWIDSFNFCLWISLETAFHLEKTTQKIFYGNKLWYFKKWVSKV